MKQYKYAIEFFFDSETEKHILRIWGKLKENNITDSMIVGGWHPHITLAIFDIEKIGDFSEDIENFTETSQTLKINFTQIGVFPLEKGFVYLAPTVTNNLLNFHKDFFKILYKYANDISHYYLPNKWIPHCSVGLSLDEKQIKETIGVCRQIGMPENATIKNIALVDLTSKETVFNYKLKE